MMFITVILNSNAIADNTIIINQQQLKETQAEISKQGNLAIANMSDTQHEMAKIKLENLDLTSAIVEVEHGKRFNNAKPLTTKLPSGEKYYLFSESVVSDSKQYLSQYSDGKPLDINKAISDYNAMSTNAKVKLGDSRLLIFISSSMPKKTIINLMQQASSLGAIFVVRGLINESYVRTYKYFSDLKGDSNVGIMINPTLFKALDVTLAPTFALYESAQDLLQTACNTVPVYTKVSGDVTVRYALEQLKQSKIASLAQIASNELDILDNDDFYKRKAN